MAKSIHPSISCLIVHSAPASLPSSVHLYHIRILCRSPILTLDTTVLRRYSQFHTLHTKLQERFGNYGVDGSNSNDVDEGDGNGDVGGKRAGGGEDGETERDEDGGGDIDIKGLEFPPKGVYLSTADMNDRLESLELYLQKLCTIISNKAPLGASRWNFLVDAICSFLDLDIVGFEGDSDGIMVRDYFVRAGMEETLEYYNDIVDGSGNRDGVDGGGGKSKRTTSEMLMSWLGLALCYLSLGYFAIAHAGVEYGRCLDFTRYLLLHSSVVSPITYTEEGRPIEVWGREDLQRVGWLAWGVIATWRIYWYALGKIRGE